MRESCWIDILSSHYMLGWMLDYSKVAQGQAAMCSLLAHDDFKTGCCIRQLPQIPVPLQPKKKKKKLKTHKKNLPAKCSFNLIHTRQQAALFWDNSTRSPFQNGHCDNACPPFEPVTCYPFSSGWVIWPLGALMTITESEKLNYYLCLPLAV